jgi:hypothetical protein
MPAPIAIFSYKRLENLKGLVQSLLLNSLASQSNLLIFSDGPKNVEDRLAVEACREYAKKLKGFSSVNLISRDENLGLSKSIIAGISEVLKNHETIIVLEDDLIVSPYFLKFMNEALDKYHDNDNVISIHGYVYPVKNKLPEIFFLRGADCWGWGTWRRGWDLFNSDGKELLNKLTHNNQLKEFNFNNSFNYSGMLRDQINGKNNSWAILWYASAFLLNKLTLYPGKSLISNAGNNGFGTHGNNSTVFDVRLSLDPLDLNDVPVEHSKFAAKAFEDYFRRLNRDKLGLLKRYVKRILGSFNG